MGFVVAKMGSQMWSFLWSDKKQLWWRCFRFSFNRIGAWLACKAHTAVEALKTTCESALPPGPQSEQRYAVGLLAEYLSPAWAEHLVACLGLQDVPVVAQKRVLSEVQPLEAQGGPLPDSEHPKKVRTHFCKDAMSCESVHSAIARKVASGACTRVSCWLECLGRVQEADLSGKEKAAQSREASKLKARAKAAKGSAAISSFFGGKK